MEAGHNPFNLPTKKEEKQTVPVNNSRADLMANSLPSDTRKDLTVDQKLELSNYIDKMRFGISGIAPIICKAEKCPYYLKCPLVRANIPLPVDKDCPVEESLQKMWLDEFIKTSGINVDVDLSAYDLLLLNDLANLQLLEARATIELANDPKIQLKTLAAFDQDGEPVFTYTLNNLIHFKEKISKMKLKILREMIGTRKVQNEEDARKSNDRSVIMADKLKRLKEQLGSDAINIVDADFTVKEDPK